jgi:hypothetical protein
MQWLHHLIGGVYAHAFYSISLVFLIMSSSCELLVTKVLNKVQSRNSWVIDSRLLKWKFHIVLQVYSTTVFFSICICSLRISCNAEHWVSMCTNLHHLYSTVRSQLELSHLKIYVYLFVIYRFLLASDIWLFLSSHQIPLNRVKSIVYVWSLLSGPCYIQIGVMTCQPLILSVCMSRNFVQVFCIWFSTIIWW